VTISSVSNKPIHRSAFSLNNNMFFNTAGLAGKLEDPVGR